MTLNTRKPTGLPPWPILLIAGMQKTGKSYAAAEASASDLIGRTLWLTIGEDEPDELGALDGARFEIVEHDGTYRGILYTLAECVDTLAADDKPGLIVVDSMTRLWNLLSDEAQARANDRARRKAEKYNRPVPEEDVTIGMDLWNAAKSRWDEVMNVLREHQGPSILTARLDLTAVVNSKGDPTPEKVWKVQAHKSLPWDVGAIVEMPEPGMAYLKGVRSLRMPVPAGESRQLRDFTVDKLWRAMGMADGASPRSFAAASADVSIRADDAHAAAETDAAALKGQIAAAWQQRYRAEFNLPAAAAEYTEHIGGDLASADVDSLRLYLTHLTNQETR